MRLQFFTESINKLAIELISHAGTFHAALRLNVTALGE
jgi:hypothetical protein